MGGWSSKDQDLRATGPWGTNLEQNLVTTDPPSWRSIHEDAGSGPLVTRLRAKMVPRGPGFACGWSPGDQRREQPGPLWTTPCGGQGVLVTRGPGRGAKLVPRGPSSRGIWSLVRHLAGFWRRSAAGVVPRGPDFEPGWSPQDHVCPQLGPRGSTRLPAVGGCVPAYGCATSNLNASHGRHHKRAYGGLWIRDIEFKPSGGCMPLRG